MYELPVTRPIGSVSLDRLWIIGEAISTGKGIQRLLSAAPKTCQILIR